MLLAMLIRIRLERRPMRRTGHMSWNNLIYNKTKYIGMEFKKLNYKNEIYRQTKATVSKNIVSPTKHVTPKK